MWYNWLILLVIISLLYLILFILTSHPSTCITFINLVKPYTFINNFIIENIWSSIYKIIILNTNVPRNAGQEEHNNIRVLSGAVRRRDLHDHDPKADAILLLQPDRALCADLLDGTTGLHVAPGLGGEVDTWSVFFYGHVVIDRKRHNEMH